MLAKFISSSRAGISGNQNSIGVQELTTEALLDIQRKDKERCCKYLSCQLKLYAADISKYSAATVDCLDAAERKTNEAWQIIENINCIMKFVNNAISLFENNRNDKLVELEAISAELLINYLTTFDEMKSKINHLRAKTKGMLTTGDLSRLFESNTERFFELVCLKYNNCAKNMSAYITAEVDSIFITECKAAEIQQILTMFDCVNTFSTKLLFNEARSLRMTPEDEWVNKRLCDLWTTGKNLSVSYEIILEELISKISTFNKVKDAMYAAADMIKVTNTSLFAEVDARGLLNSILDEENPLQDNGCLVPEIVSVNDEISDKVFIAGNENSVSAANVYADRNAYVHAEDTAYVNINVLQNLVDKFRMNL